MAGELNLGQAFGSGGLTMSPGSQGSGGGLQQGPGFGYYGARDVFRPQPQGQVLGAATGGGNRPPQQQQQQPQQQQQQNPQAPDTSVFDKMIQPVIDNFESLIGTQQGATANVISGMGTQRNTELDTEKAQTAGEVQGLNTQATDQTNSANNAVEEAKRMYAEMSQGTLAKYGTTTGTGAFLNEQLGQSTGRNIALLHQGLQQHLQDINDKVTQVKQTGDLAIRGTNERFDAAIQTEQDNLQKFIGQIKGQEGMLQSNKAQMAAQAIQHYQDTVNNLNAQREQQQQAWKVATLNAQTQLQIYGQKGQAALQQVQQGGTSLNNLGMQISQPQNIQNVTPVTPTTPQDTGSTSMARPQQNAFQTATGMNNQMNNPFNSLA